MASGAEQRPAPGPELPGERPAVPQNAAGLAIVVICAAQFVFQLDFSIVNVARPPFSAPSLVAIQLSSRRRPEPERDSAVPGQEAAATPSGNGAGKRALTRQAATDPPSGS